MAAILDSNMATICYQHNAMLKTSVDNHWKVFLMPPSKLAMN